MITLHYYLVALTLNIDVDTSCEISYIKAKSGQAAVKEFIASEAIIEKLMNGATIINTVATRIPGHVCPSNSESDYCYKLEGDKIVSVTFNVHKSSKEFTEEHVKDFLTLHF